uniref:Uncharacterized protein n=1 Tax=Arundo donax TaxID=35708 RepID=A0A0A9D029_ARUDO
MGSGETTSTTLGTALQRIEPDDPQHPANERPGGHHHAHGPESPAEAPPTSHVPPRRRPRQDFRRQKKQISRRGSNRARDGKELRRIRDGGRGRNWI